MYESMNLCLEERQLILFEYNLSQSSIKFLDLPSILILNRKIVLIIN